VSAPIEVLARAKSRFADLVAGNLLGPALEYERFRCCSRPSLPALADVMPSNAIVRCVTQLLSDAETPLGGLSLQPVSLDLVRVPVGLSTVPAWIAFKKRVQASARAAGFSDLVSSGMAGAVGELADNIVRHSERPETGVAGFTTGPGRFSYVVSDTGIGMLQSLRRCPEFRSLRDDLESLPLAVRAGISRRGRGIGSGYGYRAVFAPLAGARGTVRLRSGAAVLEMTGKGPNPNQGQCSQRPNYQGVTVSVDVAAG
jgi:hypothetical protein